MLLSVGRGPASSTGDDSLIDLLLACHRRIRHHAQVARALARPAPAAELAAAAAAVHRYFTEALPLHAADEDLSLAPRLRGRSPALDAALDRLAAEHLAHQPPLAALAAHTAALAADPACHADHAAGLAAVAAELTAAFDAHLAFEEAEVFPAIARLDADAQTAIVAELRARRT